MPSPGNVVAGSAAIREALSGLLAATSSTSRVGWIGIGRMGVVMDISDRVVVLDYGRKIGDGTPDEVRGNQAVIDAYLGVAH